MAFVILRYLLTICLILPRQKSLVVSQLITSGVLSEMSGNGARLSGDGGAEQFGDYEAIGNMFDKTSFNDTELFRNDWDGLLRLDNEHVLWVKVINIAHTTFACVGFAANFITIVTIAKHGQDFSMVMRVLLTHQAWVDGLACAIAVLTSVQPFVLWKVNLFYVDYIICHVWHSEAMYWAIIMVSIWNMVLIAVERYIAVLYPFKHKYINRKHVVGIFVLMYIFFALYLLTSGFLRMAYYKGLCWLSLDTDFIYYWSITNLFLFYLIPMMSFIILYGRVVFTLRIRGISGSAVQSDVINAASITLLKMAIAVTSVFAVTIGYAQCYFTLVFTDIIEHVIDSPVQKAAIVLNTCNVVANPFLYVFILPAFRRSMKKTFRCMFGGQTSNVDSSKTVEMTGQSRSDPNRDTGSRTTQTSISSSDSRI